MGGHDIVDLQIQLQSTRMGGAVSVRRVSEAKYTSHQIILTRTLGTIKNIILGSLQVFRLAIFSLVVLCHDEWVGLEPH